MGWVGLGWDTYCDDHDDGTKEKEKHPKNNIPPFLLSGDGLAWTDYAEVNRTPIRSVRPSKHTGVVSRGPAATQHTDTTTLLHYTMPVRRLVVSAFLVNFCTLSLAHLAHLFCYPPTRSASRLWGCDVHLEVDISLGCIVLKGWRYLIHLSHPEKQAFLPAVQVGTCWIS